MHLELHTHDLSGASTFYRELLGWRTERLDSRWGTYHGLALGGALDGGIVECGARRPLWLPYVEVEEIEATTERGRALGAAVLLEPREGPAGWRSVLAQQARVARSRSGSRRVRSCGGPDDRLSADRSSRRGG